MIRPCFLFFRIYSLYFEMKQNKPVSDFFVDNNRILWYNIRN